MREGSSGNLKIDTTDNSGNTGTNDISGHLIDILASDSGRPWQGYEAAAIMFPSGSELWCDLTSVNSEITRFRFLMERTRRSFLAGTGALAFLIASQLDANARLHGGIASGGGVGTLLKTMTVVNIGGSTVAANSHTPMIGLHFKKGDLPSGILPTLKDASANVVPYTYTGKITWSDGSTKFIGCLPRFTTAVTTSTTQALKCYSPSYSPGSSSRTLAELYAANLSLVGIGWDSTLSGTWTCLIASANVIKTVVWGDGPAGKIWQLFLNFNQSGSPHGQLIAVVYIQALQDASGNLAGFRLLPSSTTPYYNQSSPANNYLNFQSLVLQQSGSTIFDPVANSYSAVSFTWSGAGTPKIWDTSPNHTFDPGTVVQVSGNLTGTGLSPNTTYWVNPQSDSSVQLFVGPPGMSYYISAIVGTGAGTGTLTMTPGNTVFQWNRQWMAQSSGRYLYVQGGGSLAADPTLQVQMDTAYDHTTKVLPPYDLTIGTVETNAVAAGYSPSFNLNYNWRPQAIGNVQTNLGGTGERDEIGPLPAQHVRHYYTQDSQDEQLVRTMALSFSSGMPSHFRDLSTLAPLNLGNPGTTYTGMPTSLATTAQFNPNNSTCTPFTAPANVTGWIPIFSEISYDHMPEFIAYAYILTGEPQYADLLLESLNLSLISNTPAYRNPTISSTTYYGNATWGDGSIRADAWIYRASAWAAGLLPDSPPDGTGSTKYAKDIAASNAAFMVDWYPSLSSWAQANGFWYPSEAALNYDTRSSWMIGYLWMATNIDAAINESANALTMLNNFVLWPIHIQSLYGNLWNLYSYYESSSYSTSGLNPMSGPPILLSDALYAPNAANQTTLSWSSSTGHFTWSGTGAGFSPANGDKLIFWEHYASVRPGGFSEYVDYYARNVSGDQFDLTATSGSSGGSIINPSDTNSTIGLNVLLTSANGPSTGGSGSTGGSPADYVWNTTAALCWSVANGASASGLSAVMTETLYRRNNDGTNALGNPKYAMQQTF